MCEEELRLVILVYFFFLLWLSEERERFLMKTFVRFTAWVILSVSLLYLFSLNFVTVPVGTSMWAATWTVFINQMPTSLIAVLSLLGSYIYLRKSLK